MSRRNDKLKDSLTSIADIAEAEIKTEPIQNDKDEKLKDFLTNIAKGSIEKEPIKQVKELKEIYQEGSFRHRYSSISSHFLKIMEKGDIDKIDCIADNMEAIYNYIAIEMDKSGASEEEKRFERQVYKLLDHINLEQLRLRDRELFKQDLEGVQKGVKEVKELQKDTEGLKAEVLGARKEYITILGIFAAIVLAFVAGIAFSNSTLANMHLASPYRLVFVICLIGLFTLNILNYLFDFVKTIHFKGSGQTVPRYCRVWVFNVFISAILAVDFMIWSCKNDVCVAWMLKLCLWWHGVICGAL